MGLFILGLTLGLVFGAAGCYLLLVRLRLLLLDDAAAQRLHIRTEGLEAAQRIAEAGTHAQLAMIDTLLTGGKR